MEQQYIIERKSSIGNGKHPPFKVATKRELWDYYHNVLGGPTIISAWGQIVGAMELDDWLAELGWIRRPLTPEK